jgi:hypothetical protein
MGIVALTDLGRRNSSFEGQIGNEFSESYKMKALTTSNWTLLIMKVLTLLAFWG